jgi:hypothetical protein
VASIAKDILSGDLSGGSGNIFKEDASKKGFRDTGRGGGSNGEAGPLDAGDAARLRKGLLEERLRVSPADWDGRESKVQTGSPR